MNSAECVQAIIKDNPNKGKDFDNPKNWKRLSKKESGAITRKFENKKAKYTAKIITWMQIPPEAFYDKNYSGPTEEETYEIQLSNITKSFLDLCREIIENGHSVDGLLYELPFDSKPQVEEPHYEDETEFGTEDIDFENHAILELNENSIKISCGGDWQEPITFTSIFRNGKLYPDGNVVKGFEEGMDDEKVLNIIFNNDIPEEIKNNLL